MSALRKGAGPSSENERPAGERGASDEGTVRSEAQSVRPRRRDELLFASTTGDGSFRVFRVGNGSLCFVRLVPHRDNPAQKYAIRFFVHPDEIGPLRGVLAELRRR